MTATVSLPASAMSPSQLEQALIEAQQQNVELQRRVAESKTVQVRQARRLQALAQMQLQNSVLQRQAAAAHRELNKARFENARLGARLKCLQAGEMDPELERLAILLQEEQAKVRDLQDVAARAELERDQALDQLRAAAPAVTAGPAPVEASPAEAKTPQVKDQVKDQQAKDQALISTPKCLGCGKKMAPDYVRRTGRQWHGPCEDRVPAEVQAAAKTGSCAA